MPNARLTPEEVEAMLSEAAQEDAEDRAREVARWRRSQEEAEELLGEVDQMVAGVPHVTPEVLRARQQAAAIREREIAAERARLNRAREEQLRQTRLFGGNLVNVAGQVMQIIQGGQLWQHYQEPNVQLRVVQAEGDAITVAPIGISAQVGLPGLFLLTREVFARNFQYINAQGERWLAPANMDQAVDRLEQLSDESAMKPEPEDDGIERRTIWERLIDDADDMADTVEGLADAVGELLGDEDESD